MRNRLPILIVALGINESMQLATNTKCTAHDNTALLILLFTKVNLS
jgi:hypothetical protein